MEIQISGLLLRCLLEGKTVEGPLILHVIYSEIPTRMGSRVENVSLIWERILRIRSFVQFVYRPGHVRIFPNYFNKQLEVGGNIRNRCTEKADSRRNSHDSRPSFCKRWKLTETDATGDYLENLPGYRLVRGTNLTYNSQPSS